jgi:tRNA pseudouridine(55) synthase
MVKMQDFLKNIANGCWILINKPCGVTSADVVFIIKKRIRNLIKKLYSEKTDNSLTEKYLERDLLRFKIGHAGTLDPMAKGLLVIAINNATKLIPYVHNFYKEYEFDSQWGSFTDTDDTEGVTISTSNTMVCESMLVDVLKKFIGIQHQVPPRFSACKINGQRAYDMARRGEEFELQPKTVKIISLQLLNHDNLKQQSSFVSVVSTGTYVRSIVRDIANNLSAAAHTTKIKRTAIGPFLLQKALNLDDFLVVENDLILLHLLDSVVIENDKLSISEENCTNLRHGRSIFIDMQSENYHQANTCFTKPESNDTMTDSINCDHNKEVVCCFDGAIVAICKVDSVSEIKNHFVLRPIRVFI